MDREVKMSVVEYSSTKTIECWLEIPKGFRFLGVREANLTKDLIVEFKKVGK